MSHSFMTLDLATRLGFCNWKPGKPAKIGTYSPIMGGRGIGEFLSNYEKWLIRQIEEWGTTILVYEKHILIRSGKKQTGLDVAFRLYNLNGTTEKVCHDMGVKIANVQSSEWRKHFLGSAHISTTQAKDLALEKARAAGFNPQHHDAAEALGMMDYMADLFKLKRDWPNVNIFGGIIDKPAKGA